MAHGLNGFRNFDGRFPRILDVGRMIDQPANDASLIANLVQMPLTLSDCCCGNLPDQGKDRRVHAVRGQQRGAGIQQPRTRHHRVGLRPAGCQRRTQSHIGRALLMAGVDDAQAVADALKRIEEMIVMNARQCIDGVEAVGDQRGDGRLCGGHGLHSPARTIVCRQSVQIGHGVSRPCYQSL
jgi:hypothetical protein